MLERMDAMTVNLNVKQFVTFLLPMAPLLSIYKSPVSIMDLGFFLLFFIFVISVLSDRKIGLSKNDHIWLYYIGYILTVSLIAFVKEGVISGRLLKQVLYVVFLLYFLGSQSKFDYKKAIEWYKKGVLICTVYIFVQYIAYYAFSYGLPGYIPGLIYTESYADRIGYITTSSFFRPTSLTYEPTQYAAYATIAIILYLFQTREKRALAYGAFVSIGIFLSTSSIGIVCVMGIWLFWIYKSFLQGNTNRAIFAIAISFTSLVAMGCFFRGNIGQKILDRTFGAGIGMGGNATIGRFEAYGLLFDMPIFNLLFGNGYGILDGSVSYYSSWAFNFICIGMVGSVIVFSVLVHYYVHTNDTATRLIILLLFFKSIIALEFSTSTMLFYFMFILPMQNQNFYMYKNQYASFCDS